MIRKPFAKGRSEATIALVILLAVLAVFLFAPAPFSELRRHLGFGEEDDAVVDLDAPIGGPFRLVDQQGRTVSDRDFRGRYMLVVFGYSYCPDVCPLSLLNITHALEIFRRDDPARAAMIQPVFISIDPERDTPETLARFTSHFDPSLVALTGPLPAIHRVALQYGVEFEKREDESVNGYLMDHTAFIFLMGPDGQYLIHMPSDAQPGYIRLQFDRFVCRPTSRQQQLPEGCPELDEKERRSVTR